MTILRRTSQFAFLAVLVIFPSFGYLYYLNNYNGNNEQLNFVKDAVIADFDPCFSINGNEELAQYCTIGNGSIISPYIIQNIQVNYSTYLNESGIILKNTNLPLIIQNCTLISDCTTWGYEYTGMGIYLWNCSNIQLLNIHVEKATAAIYAVNVSNLIIEECFFSLCRNNGINLQGNNVNISESNFLNCHERIDADGSFINIFNNHFTDDDTSSTSFGIWITGNDHKIYQNVFNCSVSQGYDTLRLYGTNHYVADNHFINCYRGIYSICNNTTFYRNNCSFNKDGMYLYGNNCEIKQNNFSYNTYTGMAISGKNNIITDNYLKSNGWYGIRIYYSENCVCKANKLYSAGFYPLGNYNLSLDTSNTVNDYPVIFYQNINDLIISSVEIGQLILDNCNNSLISEISISDGSYPLLLFSSNNNTITELNHTFSYYHGFKWIESHNNTITSCVFTGNHNGIFWWEDSCNNTVWNNSFIDVWYDIMVMGGSGNRWDNGEIGNFWSLYMWGMSRYYDLTNNGVTWDFPFHSFGYGEIDNYPLVHPFGIAEDTDQDGLFDSFETYYYGTNASNIDTDYDGMPDLWEVLNNLDPLIDDAGEDPDKDFWTNYQEYMNRGDPHKSRFLWVYLIFPPAFLFWDWIYSFYNSFSPLGHNCTDLTEVL